MITYNEDTHAKLAARYYLYELFHSLFGTEPSEELLNAANNDVAADSFAILLPPGNPQPMETKRFIDQLASAHASLEAINADYTWAFVGPHKLPAPPWESVYLGKNKLLFQPSTLEIRNLYRSQGFLPELYPHVADDHLTLELDYVANLAKRALNSFAEQNEEDYLESIQASCVFVSEHLGKWVALFSADLATWKKESFYTAASEALTLFVQNDLDTLGQLDKH